MHVSGHQVASQVLVAVASFGDFPIKIDITLTSKRVTFT